MYRKWLTIKTRYLFLKRLYPNYVIIILKKDEYITFDIDNKIVKLIDYKFNKYNINYLILDNLEIIKIIKYTNNKYLEIKMRVELFSLLLLVSKIYQKYLDINYLLWYIKIRRGDVKKMGKGGNLKKLNLYEFCKLVVFLISIFKIPLEKIKNWKHILFEFTKLPFCNRF